MTPALARRLLWRGVFATTGGLTVTGRLPAGGCVVVANHTSHADAPALLAALPASARPAVAAAADYWFTGGVRPRVCRALVGGFAVRRSGGGSADLAAAADLARGGRAVVIFPEGTRSRTGALAAFRGGALRLAAAAEVPVVPVGIAGTRALLPVHGSLARHPVEVRIGEPLAAPSCDQARAAVAALAARPPARPDSRLRRRVAGFAGSRTALLLVACWSLAEALSFPLVPELALAVLVAAAPRAGLRLTATAAAASVVGSVLALLLYAAGGSAPQPLTTPRMRTTAAADVRAHGAAAVRHQPWSGIPVKVYAAEAGRQHVAPVAFGAQVVLGRGLRILAVGALLTGAAGALSRARRFYPCYLAVLLSGFAFGLARVVAAWS